MEEALNAMEGVKAAVNLETKSAEVTMDKEIPDAAFAEVIEKAAKAHSFILRVAEKPQHMMDRQEEQFLCGHMTVYFIRFQHWDFAGHQQKMMVFWLIG